MESSRERVRFTLSTIGVLGYTFHLMATSLFGWDDASTLISGFGPFSNSYYGAFSMTNWAAFFLGLVLCAFVKGVRSFRLCAACAFLLSALAWAMLWAASSVLGEHLLAMLAGICMGVANAMFFLLWQNAFALMEDTAAQYSIIVGSGLAGVPILIGLLVGSRGLSFALMVASLVGSFAALWVLGKGYSRSRNWISYPLRESGQAMLLAVKSLWKAACCVAALGFVRGLLPSIVATHSGVVPEWQISLLLSVGRVLSSVFLLALVLRFSATGRTFNLETVYLVVFPIMATGFLFLPFAGTAYQIAFMFVAYVVFALVSMLMMIDCLRESRRCGLHPMLVYGAYSGFVYACTQAGIALGDYSSVSGWQGLPWMFVLALLAVYVMALAFFITKMKRPGTPAETVAPIDLDAKCEMISERFGLSRREAEVLALLAKGRDLPRISKELFISDNTTRSHMRNIYRKLGVHGKQEIIDMLENFNEERRVP